MKQVRCTMSLYIRNGQQIAFRKGHTYTVIDYSPDRDRMTLDGLFRSEHVISISGWGRHFEPVFTDIYEIY